MVKDASGIFYMIGGDMSSKHLSTYNHSTNSWIAKSIMNTGREGAGSVVVNQKIYTFGGDRTYLNNSAEKYDISANTWSVITPTTGVFYSRNKAFIGAVYNKVYIIGGRHSVVTELCREYTLF